MKRFKVSIIFSILAIISIAILSILQKYKDFAVQSMSLSVYHTLSAGLILLILGAIVMIIAQVLKNLKE